MSQFVRSGQYMLRVTKVGPRCRSVGLSVSWFVGQLICRSVGWIKPLFENRQISKTPSSYLNVVAPNRWVECP